MRAIKHAILSLLRKPVKAIMIFFILLIVFLLIFTGIIIQNSISESKKYIRIQMGGIVEYTIDYEKYQRDYMDGIEIDGNVLQLSEDAASEIAKDPDVTDYFISAYGSMNSKTLKSGNQEIVDMYEGDDGPTDWTPEYNFTISYIKSEKPIEFVNNKYTLTEGRTFTEEESASSDKVVIVSEEVRKANQLNIGDKIGLINYDSYYRQQSVSVFDENGEMQMNEPKPEEYEIIGFYSGATNYEVDRIFMPFGILLDGVDAEYVDQYISSICFLVKDPLKISEFINRNIDKMPNDYMTLSAGDQQYEELTRPLDMMGMITRILIWVIFIAGTLIMISIVTIFVRDRRFEVGLLLSSGESKIKVALQFIFEILIVGVIAFGVAAGASQATSGLVADWIVENQLNVEEPISMYYSMQSEVSMEDVASEFDVGLSAEVLERLFIISLVLLVVASSIPLVIILTYQPRKALQD